MIFKYIALFFAVFMVSSCEWTPPMFDSADSFIAFPSSSSAVAEQGGMIGIPVLVTADMTAPGVTITFDFDESGDAEFLLKTIPNEFTIHQANSEVEELHVKYLIEKAQPSDEKFLVYTRTKKDDLKFVREYCETNGCLEIRYLQNYIKEKVHQTLNLNINLPKEELVAAAGVVLADEELPVARAGWIGPQGDGE